MGNTNLYQTKLICGPYNLPLGERTLIMGILNATPDSFSDGGKYNEVESAVLRAKELVEQGADILDIGGESTRPGAEQVSLEVELERVIPVIQAISKEVQVPISIDTYKAEVARQAIQAGAHIINDVWGAKGDPDMPAVAAELQVPIILMQNRKERDYHQLIPDMISDLFESITLVKRAGVKDENIILDPGIGFAKTYEDNIKVMQKLEHFHTLGYPLLLGTSRKRFIGHVLDLPAEERMEGTGATVCLGIQKGCHIVRVHDVKEIARMAKMMDAMLYEGGLTYR
ncbi:dihydropteroate synthase [Bacillus sp. CHD6a]|uniref:dihydropteroate synthase n=1 Tax=Bacillus sp. CHD6a TaxID=1643452 RepID=UPI0006CCFD62|nr:dihydropteroate synthase [Bacillus sp. CHD6a]KPB03518.1 dihydropteroate synthase [Bacillus sp. CHD6a]